MPTTIQARVTRVVFPKESFNDGKSRFCILLTNRGKCKGMLPFYPAENMVLNLTGDTDVYQGDVEFRFTSAEQEVPHDPKALLEYCAKIGKGLGPKSVEKIWSAWGESWQDHIDELAPSIGLPLRRTLDFLGANKKKFDLTMYCIQHGFGPSVAEIAWAAWGENAVATITADPYLLATLPGIGFKTVDAQREGFGIGPRDIRRAAAAVDFTLQAMMENGGDSIVSRDDLFEAVTELGIPRFLVSTALANFVTHGRIVFVGFEYLTTSKVVKQESDLARYAVENTESCAPIALVLDGFAPDQSQADAINAALSNRGLVVINGGAGAGKTTIIKAIVNSLESAGHRVNLCAFAGKAAARLREATGHEASTIHSMLQWTGEGAGFRLGNLEGITVILDEASMVPSSLLYEITKRNPTRLVLVGDQAQLQPVGIGSPFHDVIDNLPTVVHTLTTCYRNKEAVFKAAMEIRNGRIPCTASSACERFEIVHCDNPEKTHEWVLDKVRSGEVDFAEDLILAPRNGEGEEPAPCTCKSINADIQAIVNPHADGKKFKVDDRVMCIKNFAKLDIWNGTTGWISRVDIDGKPWMLPDDQNEVHLTEEEQRDSIVPAYCLTVHKSQGSQYRNVYCLVLKRDGAMLMDRSMFYTAVTRARRNCYVICDDGVDRVVSSVRRRNTYLAKLLMGEA